MEKASSYGIGCGTLLLVAGVVDLIGLALGWGDSNRSIFQILKIVGELAGSQAAGAGIFMVAGAILVLLGWGIPEIMRPDEPEKPAKDDSTPWALPDEQPYQANIQNKADDYLNYVEHNLLRNGFAPVVLAQNNQAFHKFAAHSSEYFFIPGCVNGPLTPETVEKISQKTFEFVSKMKRANSLFCYPVIVSENVPADVQKFIKSYNPKHMAQFEFPVIVDASSKKLYFYTGTPLWGGAMYGPIRDNAKTLLKFA